jgi:hypothetical protein
MQRAFILTAAVLVGSVGSAQAALLVPPPPGVTLTPGTNQGELFVDPNFSAPGTTGSNDQGLSKIGTIDLSGTATGGFDSSGSGSLHVDYGVIKMQGQFHSTGDVEALGIFRDDVLITKPGVATGTIGTISYNLDLTGTFAGTPNQVDDAKYTLQATWGGPFDITKTGGFRGLTTNAFIGDPPGVFTATSTFQYGIPSTLDVELTGLAQTELNFTFVGPDASFDMSHSFFWGGINSVTVCSDSTHCSSPTTDFSLSSGSGTDWLLSFASTATSAPEPGTFELFGIGLAGLGFARRRRSA